MNGPAPKYQGRIDRRVRNNSHSIALELIEQLAHGRSLRILDVGCAGGYFGTALKADGHVVWGVEPDPIAAALCAQRLDHVFAGGIDDFLASANPADPGFDAINFGDVLEHTADPENVLRRCRSLVAPGGAIVASVPNVAHLAVRLMLLEGRWDYDERGIMDRTHLRFFTRSSLAATFGAAGYTVDAIFPVRLGLHDVGIKVDGELAATVGAAVRDDTADVFQYVALARPAPDRRATATSRRFAHDAGPRVLAISPLKDWSIGELRLRRPLGAWSAWHGGEFRLRYMGDLQLAEIDWADVLVLQREIDPNVLRMIDEWHGRGKRIVLDLDDLLTEVPEFLVVHTHARRNRPHLQSALRAVDAVTTTTPRLARELMAFNPAVYVIPSCPLPVATPARHTAALETPLRLFIASSDSVRVDFLVPALRRLLANTSLRLELVGIGPPGVALRAEGLPIVLVDNLPYEQFGHFLAAHDNAIGLIPLDDSRFSGCKSAIKFLDYAQAGLPSICSNLPPYADTVEDGVTGLLVDNTVDAWCAAVTRLARDPDLRRQLATAARRVCRERFAARGAGDAWAGLIADVLARPLNARLAWTAARPPPRPETRHRRWLRQLRDPHAYRRAFWLLRHEGAGSVWARLRRR